MKLLNACAIAAMVTIPAASHAALFEFSVQGQLFQVPPGPTTPPPNFDQVFQNGDIISARWVVDDEGAFIGSFPLAPPASGTFEVYQAVTEFSATVESTVLGQNVNIGASNDFFGAATVLNDAQIPTGFLDQFSIGDGARVQSGDLLQPYTVNDVLPDGVFVSTVQLIFPSITAMMGDFLTSEDLPDMLSLNNALGSAVGLLNLRSGTATTDQEFLSLPTQTYNFTSIFGSITPFMPVGTPMPPMPPVGVSEPGSLAVLGLGLAFAAVRRRKAA